MKPTIHTNRANFPLFRVTATVILCFVFVSCFNGYDPKLKTPDSDGHGFNLTPLGCLVFEPWYINDDTIYNVSIYFGDNETSSLPAPCSSFQKEFVFELGQDGTVRYWFENHLKKQMATGSDCLVNKYRKKVYTKGNWAVNFRDSSLRINFTEDSLKLPQLDGKYSELGSNELAFQSITFFDTIYNGKKEVFKRIATVYYNHGGIRY